MFFFYCRCHAFKRIKLLWKSVSFFVCSGKTIVGTCSFRTISSPNHDPFSNFMLQSGSLFWTASLTCFVPLWNYFFVDTKKSFDTLRHSLSLLCQLRLHLYTIYDQTSHDFRHTNDMIESISSFYSLIN